MVARPSLPHSLFAVQVCLPAWGLLSFLSRIIKRDREEGFPPQPGEVLTQETEGPATPQSLVRPQIWEPPLKYGPPSPRSDGSSLLEGQFCGE